MKKFGALTCALMMALLLFTGCSEGDTLGTTVKASIDIVFAEENTSLLNGELSYIDKIQTLVDDPDQAGPEYAYSADAYAELSIYNAEVKALMYMTRNFYSNYGTVELVNTSSEVKSANDELKASASTLAEAIDEFLELKADYEDTISKYEGNIVTSLVCSQMLEDYKLDFSNLLSGMADFAQKFRVAFTLGYGGMSEEAEATADEVRLASFVALSDMAISSYHLAFSEGFSEAYYVDLSSLIEKMETSEVATANYSSWLSSYSAFTNESSMLLTALDGLEGEESEAYEQKREYFATVALPKFLADTTALYV